MDNDRPIQGEFDFESGNTDGFENWRRRQQARLNDIQREWGVPVGRRVRIRLRNIDGDFEGKLVLVEQPVAIDRRLPLHLRVDRIDVFIPDIERCIVID